MRRIISVLMTSIFTLSLFFGCVSAPEEEFNLVESDEPVPYEEDEFPPWMHDLRRGEIIFAGSLPFTILLSNAGYGLYSLIAAGTSGGYDITNITSSTAMTNDEKIFIILTGGALSAGIAIADFIIGLFEPEDNLE